MREHTDSVSPGDEKTDGHPQQDMNRGDLKTSWAQQLVGSQSAELPQGQAEQSQIAEFCCINSL